MTPAELLRGASDELEHHGWIRGQLVDERGRHCALGALYSVIGAPMTSTSGTYSPFCQLDDERRRCWTAALTGLLKLIGAVVPDDAVVPITIVGPRYQVLDASDPYMLGVGVTDWNDHHLLTDGTDIIATLRQAAGNLDTVAQDEGDDDGDDEDDDDDGGVLQPVGWRLSEVVRELVHV